ncbi:hypothetical protein CBS101457_005844 [Exobasidium rhododendri]|nr:hypothetical protein CBS101457_005844 [Exobasidium rhododendri]
MQTFLLLGTCLFLASIAVQAAPLPGQVRVNLSRGGYVPNDASIKSGKKGKGTKRGVEVQLEGSSMTLSPFRTSSEQVDARVPSTLLVSTSNKRKSPKSSQYKDSQEAEAVASVESSGMNSLQMNAKAQNWKSVDRLWYDRMFESSSRGQHGEE